jgi:hypothetical protein
MAPTSKHNDGWTGQPCPVCRGHQEVEDQFGEAHACGACGGTGEEYVAALDRREDDPPPGPGLDVIFNDPKVGS